MRRTIKPVDVTLGMHVLGFEGSWFDHPFWRTGFTIQDEDKLRRIRESAVTGVIVEWPDAPEEPREPEIAPLPNARPAPAASPVHRDASRRPARATAHREDAEERLSAEEIQRAKKVMKRAKSVVTGLFDQARLGRAIKGEDVVTLVDEVSEEVLRNPAAMIKVASLKTKNEYTYMHSVAVCTLMINLARTLNLPEAQHRALGMAGLLHDVGKLAVPLDILDKPGKLTAEEFEEVKQHTVRGRDLITDGADIPDQVMDVCLHHHERMDGTGYPFGLKGEQLSIAARMGGICDIYDALTSDRCYKDGWDPLQALSAMTSWEGHLDNDLMFQFMRSIGIYVPNMLVTLRSRRLALILPQGPRAKAPRARAFFDMQARELIPPEDVVLGESLRHDQPLKNADPRSFGFVHWESMKAAILAGEDPRFMNLPPMATPDRLGGIGHHA